MKIIRVQDAVGQVLCHDMTRIIPGVEKEAIFRKGHVVRSEDIPVLLSMGKEHLYAFELEQGMLHENDAAEYLRAICLGENIRAGGVKEGKIDLFSTIDGLLRSDVERLNDINTLDDIMIATRHNNTPVCIGDKLAGTRVIPLIIEESKLVEAGRIAGERPLLQVLPYRLTTAAVIATGSEVRNGLIEDAFSPVVMKKLRSFNIQTVFRSYPGDNTQMIVNDIHEARTRKVGMIILTGGMSVDPDDNTPGAIKKSGARIVTYGTPVLPGAMFLLGYFEDNTPIVGLPGSVMHAKATVFDLVLPRIAAGVEMTKADFAVLGNGGLCLGCEVCLYPVCPFGKSY